MPFPIACRYEDYTPDNAENRYLQAAVRLASRVPMVPAEDRRRLLQQLVALEDVTDAPVQADDLDRITITRLNAHYEPALRLARLLLENLTLVDRRGGDVGVVVHGRHEPAVRTVRHRAAAAGAARSPGGA